MTNTNIVVPVKNPAAAKQRLGDLLTAGQRRELALAVFEHMLSVICLPAGQAAGPPRDYGVLIVTDSAEIETRAKSLGLPVLLEKEAKGETHAVEAATRWSCEKGFTRQIVIPADLPCVTREDIETLMSVKMKSPSVVLCPATGDDGTNAILTSPPDALKFRFGKKSFPDYVDQARRLGIPCEVIRLPRLVLDIDTPEDVRTFLEEPRAGRAYQLLCEWNLRERVAGNP